MKRRDSEVEAYIFIRDKLEELGWNPKNPERNPEGEVYTQNQVLENSKFQEALDKDRPENVVKLSETKYWVIEAKNKREKIDQARKEAKEYAKAINEVDTIESVTISGVAGNDTDKYIVENYYLEDGDYETVKINGEPTSALLSPDIVEDLLEAESASLEDFPIDEEYFLSKAERINEILHNGAINKSRRGKVMSALLLSLIESEPDLDSDAMTLIRDINTRVERALEREDKGGFADQIKLNPPASEDNYTKFRNALVKTIRELKDMNIQSAMNSSADVLGEFYEVFLKYGNGAKEIGIVLTPRHVTNFAAEVIDVDHKDIVYDPTCGTGGFLVAAFDRVRQNSNQTQIDKFKEHKLFGIDQEPEVLSLAIVNMIFRGDGKNNIKEANCFHNHLTKASKRGIETAEYVKDNEEHEPPITKVLMNPPFSLNDPDEKAYRFVERTLGEMEDGGTMFCVLPYSTMSKQGKYKKFRNRLLEDNTLLSVVTLPRDLFYPVGQETVGIIVRKGQPQPENQSVLWVRALHDGRDKSDKKRLPKDDVSNDLEQVKPLVKSFVNSPDIDVEDKEKFQAARPVDFDDTSLELVPEAYLPQNPPTEEELQTELESLARETAAFILKSKQEDNQ